MNFKACIPRVLNYNSFYYFQTSRGDGMPDYLCFQCAAVVRNFKRFRDRCHRAHYALKEILSRNKEVNQLRTVLKVHLAIYVTFFVY